jgi:hypothetical protein
LHRSVECDESYVLSSGDEHWSAGTRMCFTRHEPERLDGGDRIEVARFARRGRVEMGMLGGSIRWPENGRPRSPLFCGARSPPMDELRRAARLVVDFLNFSEPVLRGLTRDDPFTALGRND